MTNTAAVYVVDIETPREAHAFRTFELTADSIREAYQKAETFADETRGEHVRGVNAKEAS